MEWVIEYWNQKKKTIECFSSDDGRWEDAPGENVVFVYVRGRLRRPHGDPSRIYTVRLSGGDNYFFKRRRNGTVECGTWNDDETRLQGGIGCHGTHFTWTADGELKSMITVGRPPGVGERITKRGVWVEEPWAERLGLTGSTKRAMKGCCDG